MTKVLPALGESSKNACRFLTGGESKKSNKVRALGPRGGLPKRDHDWKMLSNKKGGGNGDSHSFHVQKAFLKRAILARYRAYVVAQVS